MSTKNLARTVIEGGRSNHSKYLRRSSLRYLRVDNRRFCKGMLEDVENWYDAEIPFRDHDWDDISHADKTNPCDRFLASRAGRSWDAVHSEICARFDRRKLAGMHVTKDHLLNQPHDTRIGHSHEVYSNWYWKRFGGPRLWIDKNGILRHNPLARY